MAKNENNSYPEVETNEKTASKIITFLIAIVVVIIFLAFFALLIKLDIGGFGSNVLRPVLKDVPVVNKILPAATDKDLINENDYPYENIAEAVARIKELERQLASMKKTSSANGDYVSELEAEIARLKIFEENQKEFEDKKSEFETSIVFNDKAPDISEYKAYYESISPDNAATIYKQVVEQLQYDERAVELGERYAKMEPATAASILEVMTGDIDLVADILSSMKPAKSALILQEMSPEFGAKITKKMSIME